MATNVKLSFEQKTKILSDLFEEITNPDKGLSTRKCVMQDWYEIRPGLRDGTETIFYALRENDKALCGFDSLPIGTESDEDVHAFDERPVFEIVPLPNNAGFRIKHRGLEFSSSSLPKQIALLSEMSKAYEQLGVKYVTAIEEAS